MIYIYEVYQQSVAALLKLLLPIGYGWALFLISVILGIALVYIYGKVSFQKKIALVKRKISSNILESVLFRHDVGVSLAAQGKAMLLALQYALLAIPPLIILMLPAIIILGQLYPVFGMKDHDLNKPIIVTATLNDSAQLNNVKLTPVTSDKIDLTDISLTSISEKSWRLSKAPEAVKITTPDAEVSLNTKGDFKSAGVDSVTLAWVFGNKAAQTDLSKTIKSIQIEYPERTIYWLGLEWNWIILFFIVSLVAGLIYSRFAKIEI